MIWPSFLKIIPIWVEIVSMSDDSDAAQAVGAWARGGPALREGQFQTMFKNKLNIDDFDEQFITRGSICGHFHPGGWGWGGI